VALKKLTWFTKGLRRVRASCRYFKGFATKKLTWFTKGLRHIFCRLTKIIKEDQRNWPDLRRDCDSLIALSRLSHFSTRKKLTWFTKGLRHKDRRDTRSLEYERNWPDLRRDCDATRCLNWNTASRQRNWPDLRRDCDPCGLPPASPPAAPERNWPDLRRDCDGHSGVCATWARNTKKLTWFTKGLRRGNNFDCVK